MDFLDKIKAFGHLQIIKKMKDTGEEEILFDDHNVITGGLGRSIAQFMSMDGCVPLNRSCISPVLTSPIGAGNTGGYKSGGSTTQKRLPKTTAGWTRSSPPEGPGTGDGEGGAGLGDSSGLGKVDCYCLETLMVHVFIQTMTSDDVASITGSIEVILGAGCREEPCQEFERRGICQIEIEGEEGNRTYAFQYWKCKDCGKCKPVDEYVPYDQQEPSLSDGDGGGGDGLPDADEWEDQTDACEFKYGTWIQSISQICEAIATDTGGNPDVSGCSFIQALIWDLDYGKKCQSNLNGWQSNDYWNMYPKGSRMYKWCKKHPVNWRGNLAGWIDRFLDDNDINLRGCVEVKKVCDKLDSGEGDGGGEGSGSGEG